MTTIIVTHENNDIDEHDFESEIKTITIGRRSTNDVCIPNLSVSGMHAKIIISDDGAQIEDLGSTNGTYINGRLISRQLLNDGDDIVMGKTRVTFLQPSQNRAISSPVIVPDDELPEERPLTLAEKAKIPKTQPAASMAPAMAPPLAQGPASMAPTPPRQPQAQRQPAPPPPAPRATQARATTPAQASLAAAEHAPEPEWAESKTELMSPAFKRNAGPEDISEIPLRVPSLAEARGPIGLDDAIINGNDHMDSEADSSLTHAATMHSTPEHEIALDLESSTASASAVIEIKNGAKSGQVLPIDKPVTTLGRPGIQIAAIMKKPEGYFLMHIESDENVEPPQLNQSSIGDEPVLLKSGDALNVAGIDVQFMQS